MWKKELIKRVEAEFRNSRSKEKRGKLSNTAKEIIEWVGAITNRYSNRCDVFECSS